MRRWASSTTAPPARSPSAWARDELQRLSKEVDLVVLGSRGYGPVRRTLLGSTSDHLVHSAGCSVVVVPRSTASAERVGNPPAAAARAR